MALLINKFVQTAHRYKIIEIRARVQHINAADPLPDDLHEALDSIQRRTDAH